MQSIRLLLCALLAFVTLPLAAFAAEPPTMGWSSWNTYRVNISDSLICRQADAMKRLGLGRVGYKYINIGDGFFGGRAADGTLLIGCDLTTIPPASLALITLNVAEPVRLRLPASAPGEAAEHTLTVKLKKGRNTLRLGHDTAPLPAIDCLRVER